MKPLTTNTRALATVRRTMRDRGIDIPMLAQMVGTVGPQRIREVVTGEDNPSFALAGVLAQVLKFDPGLWFRPYRGNALDIPIPSGVRAGPGRGHRGESARPMRPSLELVVPGRRKPPSGN